MIPDPVGGSPVFGRAPGAVAVPVAAGVAALVAAGVAAAPAALVAVAAGAVVAAGVAAADVAAGVPEGVAVWANAGTNRNRNIATAAKARTAVIANVLFIIGVDSFSLV